MFIAFGIPKRLRSLGAECTNRQEHFAPSGATITKRHRGHKHLAPPEQEQCVKHFYGIDGRICWNISPEESNDEVIRNGNYHHEPSGKQCRGPKEISTPVGEDARHLNRTLSLREHNKNWRWRSTNR